MDLAGPDERPRASLSPSLPEVSSWSRRIPFPGAAGDSVVTACGRTRPIRRFPEGKEANVCPRPLWSVARAWAGGTSSALVIVL